MNLQLPLRESVAVISFRRTAVGVILCLAGCTPQAEIREYTIPSTGEATTTDRLIPLYAKRPQRPAPVSLPKFEKPDSWRTDENDQFSSAAFAAGTGDDAVRITITQTPAAVGIDAQLGRWRGQIGLDPQDTEDGSEDISMNGTDAVFVNYTGPGGESIAGAIAELPGRLWFFKMKGPTETVTEELQRMKDFCRSVQFETD